MQYQCRVIILHGLQRKDCRKDGVLACRSSNKSFQPTETGIEMIDTDHSQKTLYIQTTKDADPFYHVGIQKGYTQTSPFSRQ